MNVHVQLGGRSYPIHIGSGELTDVAALCRERLAGSRIFIITDETVNALYGDRLAAAFEQAGYSVTQAVAPPGEATKSMEWYGRLCERAAEAQLDRASAIVAFGGGVIGDLAGFVAATYMRGIQLVQIPTTLLAMVDSAVGGKTGINLPQGKNLVGAFHQPALVVCDLDLLRSLPRREFSAGLAEVIKYGIIRDPELFEFLEKNVTSILAGDTSATAHIVARSCAIKAAVVSADERESGERAILNFGHTLGHAIEQASNYARYLHGEAIGIGMVYAARLSARVRGLPASDVERIRALVERAGLPVAAPELAWSDLRRAITVDKKGVAGMPRFVLARRIGDVEYGIAVTESLLEDVWHGRGE
jgi:3-dehydroquinate synthase